MKEFFDENRLDYKQTVAKNTAKILILELEKLSKEDRVAIMHEICDNYCYWCGHEIKWCGHEIKGKYCSCMNDERIQCLYGP